MQSVSILSLTVTASASVSEERFIAMSGDYPSAGASAFGVNRSAAETGTDTPVAVIGTATVLFESAVAQGGAIEVGADGQAVPKSSGVTVARALTAVAAGNRGEVLLIQS